MAGPDSADQLTRRADLLGLQTAEIWRALLRALALVQVGLVVACVVSPLVALDDDPPSGSGSGSSSESLQRLTLLRAVLFYLTARDRDLGDLESHPLSVPGGRVASLVLLLVLLALLVLAVAATIGVAGEFGGRAVTVLGTICGVALILATLLLAVVQKWLDNDDVATPLQAGLWLPIAAGAWLVSMSRARRGWDGL